MSIKGFKINGNVEKYDYNSLENLPDLSGGSTKEWELIRTVVLEEDVQLISIRSDENGNPFEYDEIAVRSFTMEGEDNKKLDTCAIWVNDTDVNTHAVSNSLYWGFAGRHVYGYYSPTIVYLRPFIGHFRLTVFYHDAALTKDAFLAQNFTTVDDAISAIQPDNILAPTNKVSYNVVNADLVTNCQKATKITSFSYGAPFYDHLVAAGSIFEFYGR